MKRKLLVAVLGLTLAASLVGCGSNEASNENVVNNKITLVGSTSVTPVAEKLAEAYMQEHEGMKVEVQGIGSSAGIRAVKDGNADIGMSSRNLKTEEKEWGLTEAAIAYDGITVIVNPNNEVSDLKLNQVKDIYEGNITNWKEIGGIDKEIIVVSREDGSGTRGAFEDIVKLLKKDENGKKVSTLTDLALIGDGNGSIKANVAAKENAIGYISLSYVDETVKGLSIDGVESSVEMISAGDYKISRPFLMLTSDGVTDEAKGFLEFILSDKGQAVVEEKLIRVN